MAETGLSFAAQLSSAGVWAGLIVTLLIFSLLLGDNVLARLAQHVVVGAALAYAVVAIVYSVVNVRIVEPLVRGAWQPLAIPLVLCALLLIAGLDRILVQGRAHPAFGPLRRTLQTVGVIPLAILLGVGLATGAAGIVQGTLGPQARQVMNGAFANGRAGPALWMGLLTLLLTTGTLLALTVDRRRQVDSLPRPLRGLLGGWVWIGQRALWIASGAILARLFAARLTLLVDRMDYIVIALRSTGIWQWASTLWQSLQG